MFTKNRHVAIHTENYDIMAKCYQTIFQMKKITNGITDENGDYNPNRGNISDRTIGLALVQRMPGSGAGLDHIRFKVEDLESAKKELEEITYLLLWVMAEPRRSITIQSL